MNDAIAAVVWLLVNAMLVSTAWKWHRRLFPKDGMGFAIMHTVILCWAGVIGITILLGALGMLSPGLLVAHVCVLCIIVRVLLRTKATPWPRREAADLFASFDRKAWWWAVAWGLLGGLLVARVITGGLLVFPTDWDTLAYHLPLVDHWIRARTLYVPDCAFWYCPGNNEILGLWCVGLFSGDFLISLNNLPAVVLLAAATVELAGLLNISRSLRHLGAMVVVGTEVTWRQAVSAENDAAMAALFFATLVYGMRFAKRGRPGDMWVAGVSVGLLSGIKYVAVMYAAAAGVSLLVLLAIRRRSREVFAAAVVGLACALVFGGYWYARNTYYGGTPLYPKGFTAATDLWGKIRPNSSTSCLLLSGRAEVWPRYAAAVRKVAGIGPSVALVVLPAVVPWIGVSVRAGRRMSRTDRQTRAWFALVMILATLVGVLTPNIVETAVGTMNMLRLQYHSVRLSLPFASICVIGLLLPLSDVLELARQGDRPSGAKRMRAEVSWLRRVVWLARKIIVMLVLGTAVTVGGCQLMGHIWHDVNVDCLFIGVDVFMFGLLLVWSAGFLMRHRRITLVTGTLAVCVVGVLCEVASRGWHAGYSKVYDWRYGTSVFTELEATDRAKERLCICDNCYYPFFGSRRENDICRPLWLPNYAAFLRYVRQKQATIVVTRNVDSNAHRRYVNVAQWIATHGKTFKKIGGDRQYTWARVVGHEGKKPGVQSPKGSERGVP